jgi:hypothetical protein
MGEVARNREGACKSLHKPSNPLRPHLEGRNSWHRCIETINPRAIIAAQRFLELVLRVWDLSTPKSQDELLFSDPRLLKYEVVELFIGHARKNKVLYIFLHGFGYF